MQIKIFEMNFPYFQLYQNIYNPGELCLWQLKLSYRTKFFWVNVKKKVKWNIPVFNIITEKIGQVWPSETIFVGEKNHYFRVSGARVPFWLNNAYIWKDKAFPFSVSSYKISNIFTTPFKAQEEIKSTELLWVHI